MQKILVMNLGTTSFKCKLFEMDAEEKCLATGEVESIGFDGRFQAETDAGKRSGDCRCENHMAAFDLLVDNFKALGVRFSMNELAAAGFKVVHGGRLSGAMKVDEALLQEMRRMVPFAPAHNPIYLSVMESFRASYPDLVQIACFETAFHSTMPLYRALYGVPYEWAEKYGIRRYGFHGSSHSYIAWKMREEAPEARRFVSVHLGGSCSLCAVKDGKSVASSMGATPQGGVLQNNRVGDFDIFCLKTLAEQEGGTEAVLEKLSKKGGLLGLSGVSNDMRKVEEAAAAGNRQARLAIDAFADEIVGYIGMQTAYLGGLDAICFTGGIGTNGAAFRREIVKRLGFVNARLSAKNEEPGVQGKVSAADSGIGIYVYKTNEELMVARGCISVLSGEGQYGTI